MKAIRVHQFGGPEVLRYEEAPLPEPGKGEARVKIEAIGLNYIDIYHRTGLYPLKTPFTLGMEGAGVVDAVAADVTDAKKGDRVAYAMEQGAYAEYAIAPAWKLAPVPQSIDSRTAAATMLQGMTAHYLTHDTYPLKKGETALIHAAAGGVGLLLTQVAKRLGATVFGTVSTEEKARLAREAGADQVILYTQTDFSAEVKRLTNGRGVHVVYDSVGQSTFEKSLDCLRSRGYLALFGQSSGPVPPFNLGTLAGDREQLLRRASDLFNWIASGQLKLKIDRTFRLAEAAEAHRLLEGRKTTGKVILTP
ncbi:MAG: quinone oxidoreductase [Deltaproteobacteria bacterium]|nr:MAG: quinone oxidoreductase [Deltaproteobacteria bacterium]